MSSFQVGFPSAYGAPATHWRWTGSAALTIHAGQTHIEGRRSRPFWFSGPQSATFENERVRDVLVVGTNVSCKVHMEGWTPEPLVLRAESEQQAREIAALWPEAKSREFVEQQAFESRLSGTGATRVTQVLVGACVLMFLLPVLGGISIFEPDGAAMVHWGTNFGPLTLSGQAWRLFTAMFLHFGILHLALNMWALLGMGPLVERLLGSARYALLYVLAGLGGSIASVAWNPGVNSAGASGAIFGVMGALLALMVNPKTRIPPSVAAAQRNSALLFIAYNVFNGLAHQGIDNAAHLGGLASGFALGWMFALPVGTRPEGAVDRRLATGVVASLAILGAVFTWVQHPGAGEAERRQLVAALQPFFEAEGKAIDLMQKLSDELKAGKVGNEAAAARMQREVRPLWQGAAKAIDEAAKNATGERRQAADAVGNYLRARLDQADLMVDLLKTEDAALNARAQDVEQEVNRRAEQAGAALKVLNP